MLGRYIVVSLLLVALSIRVGAAGKVSTDPNVRKRGTVAGAPQDGRLAKKVTIRIGGKRLHAICDNLAKASDIKVRSGKNASDWSVRDLPVDVFAKDVVLEKLVGWVGEAAHVAVVMSKTGEDSMALSLRRDKKGEKELADDEARGLAQARWCWDAFAKLGRQTGPVVLDKDAEPAAKWAVKRKLAAKIVASLSADAKERVFSGEAVLLDARSSPQAQLVREMVLAIRTGGIGGRTMVASGDWSAKRTEPSESDPEHTMLTVQLFDLGGQRGTAPVFVLSPMVCGSMVTSSDYELKVDDADTKGLDIPPRPQARPLDNDPEYDCGGSKRQFITSEKDWDAPVLRTKVHLDLPAGDRTDADVLSALAEASGFSVVCEDFMTCRLGSDGDLKGLPADTTIGDVLKRLSACWFSVDEKERLILGWARNWRGHQRDLVPESLISNLSAKIHGDGAELDDVTPLANLSTGQMNEWIRENPELRDARFQFLFVDRMMWRVYDSLSSEAKTMAKTEAGAPLTGIDLDVLREDFRRLRRYDELTITVCAPHDESDRKRVIAEAQTKARLMADPAQLQSATLWIMSKETEPVSAPAGGLVLKGSSADKSATQLGGKRYWMELSFFGDAGPFTLRVDGGPGVFPVRVGKKSR